MSIVVALIVFCVLVTVHELGHFVAAKKVGINVLEFAIGMGPAIFKKEHNGTIYSIRILPIGGFCKMQGEDEDVQDEGSLQSVSAPRRFLALFSGAFLNIVMGFLVLLLIMFMSDRVAIPVIAEVMPESAAQSVGLMPGDRILEINGTSINLQNDVTFEMSRQKSDDITIVVQRDGQRLTHQINTPYDAERGTRLIGYIADVQELTFSARVSTAFYQTLFVSKVIVVSVFDLITGGVSAREMSGPVGIVNAIGEATKTGVADVLFLTALISINLGVFNLLPIPALDGGRLLFLLIECIIRRKVSAKIEGAFHLAGFALLIILMLFATSNDIMRLINT